ncbi:hypothetical protein BGZ73_003603 [Actinomortierella ambigua]|nr:hypothetical protein BGZ73_003603 [Actinomortierella ambigua]
MSTKDPTATEDPHAEDTNAPPLPPPPSYSESGGSAAKFTSQATPAPAGQGTSGSVYQAQPVAGSSSGIDGAGPFAGQTYPPMAPGGAPGSQPFGPPGAYPPGPPGSHPYVPPAGGQPYGPPGTNQYPQPPPGTSAVIYVVDDPMASPARANRGMPMAMLFFILGLCTWLGYFFGMCYLNHPDPRERWWARMCAIMSILWALIIIFASIFGSVY